MSFIFFYCLINIFINNLDIMNFLSHLSIVAILGLNQRGKAGVYLWPNLG